MNEFPRTNEPAHLPRWRKDFDDFYPYSRQIRRPAIRAICASPVDGGESSREGGNRHASGSVGKARPAPLDPGGFTCSATTVDDRRESDGYGDRPPWRRQQLQPFRQWFNSDTFLPKLHLR
ncbi:hypothetical protein GCM10020229_26620 [Kitasatospora albolonga]